MNGWAAYFLLVLWAVIAHVCAPSTQDVQRVCAKHGHVVSYTAGGFFDFTNGVVVCSDGRMVDAP